MPAKPETKLSQKVLTRLRAEGGWWAKIHGGVFQVAGIPDILGCWEGRFVAIELKVGKNEATLLQGTTLNKLIDCGARAGVAYDVERAIEIRDGKNICKILINRG